MTKRISRPTAMDPRRDWNWTRILILSMQLALPVFAHSEPASGTGGRPGAATLARACSGCHGEAGERDAVQIPAFTGLRRDVFIERMRGFKSGDVRSSIMNRIAKGYQDADFVALANFYELP